MQGCAPRAVDLSNESEVTRKLYGMDEKITEPFGRQCLMARRLVEHGVRFVQLFHGGKCDQKSDTWGAPGDGQAENPPHAPAPGRPLARQLSGMQNPGLGASSLVMCDRAVR